jgi:predicted ribosomally synthesized peptide with SipW-like signal peptide
MTRSKKLRIAIALVTAASAVGFAALGSGMTGAYFSDTHTADQTSTVARVAINDPSSADAAFGNLVAGQSESRTFTVTNTGTVNENVYLKRAAVTGLPVCDTTPSKLTVSVSSAAAGTNTDAANASPASILLISDLAPGASRTYTLTIVLDATAGGTYDAPTCWNAANNPTFSVTVPVKLVGAQMSAGWLSIS